MTEEARAMRGLFYLLLCVAIAQLQLPSASARP
jgi:hypothetical protein